jgi:hypothetical protein
MIGELRQGRLTKGRLGIGVGLAAIIVAAVFLYLSQHPPSSPPAPSASKTAKGPAQERAVPAAAPTAVARAAAVGGLWMRPPAEMAARQFRRQGYAWIMRQLGASEELLDRLANGELASVLRDLKKGAQSGDPAAVNMLGEFAYQACHLGRSEEVLSGFESRQMADARMLPPDDESWFDKALHEDVTHDKAVASVCKQQIDVDEVLAKVAAQSAGGDGASLWIMANAADHMIDRNQRMRDAAASGFPEAQFELAWTLIAERSHGGGASTNVTDVGELLRQASDSLPVAEGELAVCEDAGCQGVTANAESAISHAREAAERGSIDALITIGPHMPISVIDPDEVSAWTLVQTGLQQQGCVGQGFDVRSMKSMTSTLNAATITPNARSLADQYWQEYGAQIRSNLGCTP